MVPSHATREVLITVVLARDAIHRRARAPVQVVVYSDDCGMTWQMSETPLPHNGAPRLPPIQPLASHRRGRAAAVSFGGGPSTLDTRVVKRVRALARAARRPWPNKYSAPSALGVVTHAGNCSAYPSVKEGQHRARVTRTNAALRCSAALGMPASCGADHPSRAHRCGSSFRGLTDAHMRWRTHQARHSWRRSWIPPRGRASSSSMAAAASGRGPGGI